MTNGIIYSFKKIIFQTLQTSKIKTVKKKKERCGNVAKEYTLDQFTDHFGSGPLKTNQEELFQVI